MHKRGSCLGKISKAVSVVFTYQDQVFFIKRQYYLRDFPGFIAFPGGKLDKQDMDVNIISEGVDGIEAALFNCLRRECLEEIHIDVLDLFEMNRVLSFDFVHRFVTPESFLVRFQNDVYHIHLNERFLVETYNNEILNFSWMTLGEFLDSFTEGDLMLIPPFRFLYPYLKQKLSLNLKLKNRLPATLLSQNVSFNLYMGFILFL